MRTNYLAAFALLFTTTALLAQQPAREPTAQAGVALDAASAVPDIEAAFSGGIDRSTGTIGRAAEDISGFGAASQGGAQGRNPLGRGFGGGLGGGFGLGGFGLGGFGAGGFGNSGLNNQNQEPSVRTRLVSQVEVVMPSPAQRLNTIRGNLESIPIADRFTGVTIALDGRTAILTGNVESKKDRDLLERLIKLEPGVSTVTNDVEIVSLEELPVGPANDD